MMRQRWGLGTLLGASGIAALIAACSGNDIPPISDDDRATFEEAYGDGEPSGAAGSSMSGGAGAGGGSMVSRGGSGGGGAPAAGGSGSGGTGGSGAVGGGGVVCDAPTVVFAPSCAVSSTCHGAGSGIGDFAASPAAAEAFLNEPSLYSPQCGLWIDSANPEESLLLTKVNDTYDKQNCGPFRMPQSGDFLEAEDEACILSWLNQFAD